MNKQELKVCPYDPAHKIHPIRFASHIQRCRKANPGMNLKICPYNSTHHVPSDGFEAHTESCEDKCPYSSLYACSFTKATNLNPKEVPLTAVPGSYDPDDDWEVETEAEAKAEAKEMLKPGLAVLYTTKSRIPDASIGLGKAGRKLWRDVDTLRIRRIKENLPIEDLEYPTAAGGWITIGEMVHGPGWRKRPAKAGSKLSEEKASLSDAKKSEKERSQAKPKEASTVEPILKTGKGKKKKSVTFVEEALEKMDLKKK